MKQIDIVKKMIPVTKPYLPPKEELQKYIDEIYDNNYLTNNGPLHKKLAMELCKYLGVDYLTLVVNGHSGLDIALKGLNIRGEVITTPFTFVSTVHALTLNGIEPVFCDIKRSDLTIDESKIESMITPKTTAIMPVHVYGHMCDVKRIEKLAKKYNLKVIYDAAHAFGVKYRGKALANYGDVSMLSFHATKIFNTIEGGALIYNNGALSRVFDAYKNFGIEGPEKTDFVGGNAKMNEFQAAMGLANLAHMQEIMNERKTLVELYREQLNGLDGISYFVPEKMYDNYEYNYSYFPILIEKEYGKTRNELYDYLLENNVYARKYFYPIITQLGCYRKKYASIKLPVAEDVGRRVMCLPLYNGLSSESVLKICELIKNFRENI
ncbi:DegT/DnrJ/EryC1/StrS family aminotransferase [Candidatus Saccharibacteria bacterium]|nr:DegT/DnrJ/EryC1/StrS family aminotransferase [Candidatus Saccharibacteria bacterium]